jgi:hypothetical protein
LTTRRSRREGIGRKLDTNDWELYTEGEEMISATSSYIFAG